MHLEYSIAEISIHALREEGDKKLHGFYCVGNHFYPRPPRGGRPPCRKKLWGKQFISIHALREEGDVFQIGYMSPDYISIHALREEGDATVTQQPRGTSTFLSTPSARRATCWFARLISADIFLSTPSARRATALRVKFHQGLDISIHALREEGDMFLLQVRFCQILFLSTPSARRATRYTPGLRTER